MHGVKGAADVVPKPEHPQDAVTNTPSTSTTESTESTELTETCNEEEGDINFDKINKAIDEMEAAGVKTDLAIPTLAKLVAASPEKVKALLEDEGKLMGLINFL